MPQKSYLRTFGRKLVSIESYLIIITAIYVAILAIGFSFLRILSDEINPSSIISGIGCAIVAVPLLFIAYHVFMKTSVKMRYIIAVSFSLIIGGLWSLYICTITPSDDQLVVSRAASTIAENKTFSGYIGSRTQLYMEQYPYQSGFTLYLILLSKIFGSYPFMQARVINVIMMSIVVLLMGRITWELFNSRKAEAASLMLSSLFMPISMASYKVYGNVLVMPFLMATVLVAIRVIKNNGRSTIRDMILLGLLSMMCMAIKPNSMIVIIAIIASLVLHAMNRRKLIPILATAVMLVAVMIGNAVPPAIYGAMTGFDMHDNKVHYNSWIAIGILEDHGMYGFYDGRFFPYTKKDVAEKDKKADKAISQRLREFTSNPMSAAKFYWMKTAETWGDPSFGILSDNYLQVKAWKKSKSEVKKAFHNLNGTQDGIPKWNEQQLWFYSNAIMPTQTYADGMQIVIMVMVVFGMIITKRRMKYNIMGAEGMMTGLAFLGGFVFHVIWETQPEYALPYFIMLIPYAGLAMSSADNIIRRILHRHDRTQRGVSSETQNTVRTSDSDISDGPERKSDHAVLAGDMEDTMQQGGYHGHDGIKSGGNNRTATAHRR